MFTRIGLVVSSLIVAFGPSVLQAQAGPGGYTYVAIPTLPGGTYTSPSAINNRNLVVGYADVADGSTHGFIYDIRRNTMSDIGEGFPLAINDYGEAVGRDASNHAVRFLAGQAIALGSLPGEARSEATSINNVGAAVGLSLKRGSPAQLVLYRNGQAHAIDLGLSNYVFSGPLPVINDNMTIAGTIFLLDSGVYRAFQYNVYTGKTTVLKPIGTDTDTWGLGINARGEVLCNSFVFNQAEHIGVWGVDGKFTVHFTEGTTQYPTLSNNLLFNDEDQIVITQTTDGTSYLVPTIGHRDDLDLLVVNLPPTEQALSDIAGINNVGVMTGSNFDSDSNQVGFVLLPLGR